ncbi:MAG: hypothetical protein DI628_07185 [Blastochloris viridis]|uniref:Uncharacterized protein n=1 Tax=Blastochloris viridis TaxID=1079 RepID=A0A6N4RC97_BLAVI|nr:MAG: hypothetical protein DI628_07185 [Blastochloris viridis]
MTFARLIARHEHQTASRPKPPQTHEYFGLAVHHVLFYLNYKGDPLQLSRKDIQAELTNTLNIKYEKRLANSQLTRRITLTWHAITQYVYENSTYFTTEVGFLGNRKIDLILEHPDGTIELVEIKTYKKKTKTYCKRTATKQLADARKFILEHYPDTKLKWTKILIQNDLSKPFKCQILRAPS